MRYGGKLDRRIIDITKEWQEKNNWELLPGQPLGKLEEYFYIIEANQQFRQLHNKQGELIAYADYWIIEHIQDAKFKKWVPLWPLFLSKGDIIYNNWAWVHPEYRMINIMGMFLKDLRRDFPEKVICFHRVKNEKEFFLKFKPLRSLCTT